MSRNKHKKVYQNEYRIDPEWARKDTLKYFRQENARRVDASLGLCDACPGKETFITDGWMHICDECGHVLKLEVCDVKVVG